MSLEIKINPVCQKGLIFPEELYLQVHTSNTFNLITEINQIQQNIVKSRECSNDIKNKNWTYIERDFQLTFIEHLCTLFSSETSTEANEKLISMKSLVSISNTICKTLPEGETPCYFKALSYAQKAFKDKSINEFKPDEILTLLNNIHSRAANTKDLQYRTEELCVVMFNFNERSLENLTSIVNKIVTDKKDLQTWSSICKKKDKIKSEKFFRKYFIAPTTNPQKISNLMKQFSVDFVKNFKAVEKKSDIITLMAWAHLELVKIHPWDDCNGRVARIFMHIIALQLGLKPIIFDNDDDYTLAIIDFKTEKFTKYLNYLQTQQRVLNSFNKSLVRDWLDLYHKPSSSGCCGRFFSWLAKK